MAASGQSLMPEGLEKDLTPRDMADLIAFLEGVGPPPKAFAGNHPRKVKPGADGRIVLAAADAEIYGDSLVFEPQLRQPRLLDVAQRSRRAGASRSTSPGKYAVWLDWACPADAAGNVLEINLGGQQIHFQDHRHGHLGRLRDEGDRRARTLTAGTHRLEVRPAAAPKNRAARPATDRAAAAAARPRVKVTPTPNSTVAAGRCSCCERNPSSVRCSLDRHRGSPCQSRPTSAPSPRRSISCRSRPGCR